MNPVARADRDQSLKTMWNAYRFAVGASHRNRSPTAGRPIYIGQFYDSASSLSYLNARYYDASRGQFITQDPVFWEIAITPDGQQALLDPQQLNSYGYASDNPINKKDPQGRCPVCVPILLAGGIGTAGGIANQAFNDYLTGDFGRRAWQDNVSTYAVAAGQGAIVGSGVAAATLAAPLVGLTSTGAGVAVASAAAGTLTAGTTAVGNYVLGQQTDPSNLLLNSTFAALSAGTLRAAPGVRGRWPNIGTSAFFTGALAQRSAAEELFGNSVQTFGMTAARVTSPQNYSGRGSGGGATQSFMRQLQSLVSSLRSLIATLSSSASKK
jgi:RHS repeat-associated protein